MATANLLQTSVSGGTQNALSLQGDGVFFPKASTTSRLALTLTTTDKGFIVYDTTDNNIYFWNGAAWESVPSSGDAGANGSVQYNDNGIVSGASNFTYDKATSAVSIAGALTLTGGTANGVPYLNASKVVTTGSNLSFANTPGFFDTTLNINSLLGSALYRGGITVAEDNVGFTLFGGSGYKLIQTSGFSTPNQLSFYASNAEQYRIGASGVFTWLDGAGGTRMTLNSTGLGVGTTNYIGKIQAAGLVAAADPTFGTSGTFIGAILNNDNTAPGLDLRRWTGAAANHGTTYISTDATGATFFYNGTQASNTKATSLKMTLDASGNLLVGTPSALNGTSTFVSASNSLSINSTGAAGIGNALIVQRSVGDGNVLLFINQGVSVGTIVVTATATAYNTSSDYRLKQSVKPLAGGLARVNSLKPSTYKWNLDGSAGEGFIAHELAEVVPFAVSGQKDAVNEDGSIKIQGVDLSKIVPILVAAIQELTTRVQTLEAR
jgi:hypothetical protein